LAKYVIVALLASFITIFTEMLCQKRTCTCLLFERELVLQKHVRTM